MPPSTGQKRHRQIPANNSLITSFYQPQKKRQDTKISSNNENQVSFDQFKKDHLQSSKKRGLSETTTCNNNKNNSNNNNNKKPTERQPLQQIGGLATNKNLNTGLKNKPGQEQRDAWCVYSDPPENDYGDDNDNNDNNNDVATPASRAPFVVFRDSNEQENKNNDAIEDKKGESDKDEQESLHNTQLRGQAQENNDEEAEPTEENNSNNDQFCARLAPQKQNTFNLSDDDFSDEEDEHKGFFDDDDDDDDMLITTTKRPNMNALGTITRLQQQREELEENDLVPQFSIPQFSIPVQSPVFNDPEPSDDDDNDDGSDKENEDAPLFPALPSPSTTTTSNTNDNNSRIESSSIEKHDSKLDNNDKYNYTKDSYKKSQITKASPDITTATPTAITYNASSLDNKSISSLEATIPMEPTEQYETHVPYPLPRGGTLLEKFGIEKMHSDTSTSSSGSSTNRSVSVSSSRDKTVGDSPVRRSDENTENFEDDGRLLSATVPMDPTEQQYEAHVPYAVPRGTNLLEKLGLQNGDDTEAH